MNDVSIVVVSYNSRADLAQSLPALVATGRHLIVVDNASNDGSAGFVREHFPDASVLELEENVGYGAACNVGVHAAEAPFVLMLNPDAWPVGDGVDSLVECARRPELGAVAPQLHGPDGKAQQTLVGFPTPWWTGRPAVTSAPPRRLRVRAPDRGFLVGAALLVRREAFEQVGGFDPSFFMFFEEVDLCLRLERAGWRVAVCSEATFVHIGGTATRRDWPRMYREQLRGHLRLLAKHEGPQVAERARRYLTWAVRLRALASPREDRAAYTQAVAWLTSGDVVALLDANPAEAPRRAQA
jgi:GT2 family glycosyltransferase